MKNSVLNQGKDVILATLLLVTATSANAQLADKPIEPPRPGMERPRPEAIKEITTISGTVSKLATNDDFVYDGFYVSTSNGDILVKFPPHLGSQITALAKDGNQVTVKGVADVTPTGEKNFRLNSITVGGKTIEDVPPVAPTTPPQEVAVSESGTISELQKNKEGDAVVGLFVNNTIVKMPPHIYQQLGQSLVKGAKISYSGFKKPENNGEVAAKNYKIVHARTISVNGKEYQL